MTPLTVVAVVTAAAAVFVVVALGHWIWRIVRGDEESEPGGSLGDQLLGRWNRR